jgi:hypothetical protein
MVGRIVAIGAMGAAAVALLNACSMETRTVVGEDVCASYGLRIDSPEYRKCRAREGRSGAGYTPAQLMTASRQACSSYGIMPYTEQYERCVRNEYAFRSHG